MEVRISPSSENTVLLSLMQLVQYGSSQQRERNDSLTIQSGATMMMENDGVGLADPDSVPVQTRPACVNHCQCLPEY
jgi:hypothetical protein